MIVARLYIDDTLRGWRSKPRRTLRLDVHAVAGEAGVSATIRNLSETGLLLETDPPLAVGDIFQIDLPLVGEQPAEIMWVEGRGHGCRFLDPIPKSAVSAAALLAPFEEEPQERAYEGGVIDEFFDNTLPQPGDRIWYAANAAIFLLVLAAFAFVLGMVFSATG